MKVWRKKTVESATNEIGQFQIIALVFEVVLTKPIFLCNLQIEINVMTFWRILDLNKRFGQAYISMKNVCMICNGSKVQHKIWKVKDNLP